MDHENCRARIEQLESELADQEIELAVKDELIAALTAENMRFRADREFVA